VLSVHPLTNICWNAANPDQKMHTTNNSEAQHHAIVPSCRFPKPTSHPPTWTSTFVLTFVFHVDLHVYYKHYVMTQSCPQAVHEDKRITLYGSLPLRIGFTGASTTADHTRVRGFKGKKRKYKEAFNGKGQHTDAPGQSVQVLSNVMRSMSGNVDHATTYFEHKTYLHTEAAARAGGSNHASLLIRSGVEAMRAKKPPPLETQFDQMTHGGTPGNVEFPGAPKQTVKKGTPVLQVCASWFYIVPIVIHTLESQVMMDHLAPAGATMEARLKDYDAFMQQQDKGYPIEDYINMKFPAFEQGLTSR
jgi:hypothetical protein